ncbi:uncharacterized protein [Miscanthus floridulus]|uniref:uncharacterized protein n=1 Tax=Miscanthus floridulus TaxID=154761 RepID=UPI003459AB7E
MAHGTTWPPAPRDDAPQTPLPQTTPTTTKPPQHVPVNTQLTTPTYDVSTDPRPWISRIQQISNLYRLLETQQTCYAAYHLTGEAHRWYMRATKDTPMTKWAYFTESIICNFGPDRNITSNLAPPHHIGPMNNYINNFIAYALHTGITSEQHQVSLSVNGLQDALRVAVIPHHPRTMETAIDLARTMETPTPATTTNTGRSIPATGSYNTGSAKKPLEFQ